MKTAREQIEAVLEMSNNRAGKPSYAFIRALLESWLEMEVAILKFPCTCGWMKCQRCTTIISGRSKFEKKNGVTG